jgi:hypothetical protein
VTWKRVEEIEEMSTRRRSIDSEAGEAWKPTSRLANEAAGWRRNEESYSQCGPICVICVWLAWSYLNQWRNDIILVAWRNGWLNLSLSLTVFSCSILNVKKKPIRKWNSARLLTVCESIGGKPIRGNLGPHINAIQYRICRPSVW